MKTVIREFVRCAALIYLLGAPWAIVSSRVEGLGVVLLLAGILPAGSFLFGVLKRELEAHLPATAAGGAVRLHPPETPSHPNLRLVSNGAPGSVHRRS